MEAPGEPGASICHEGSAGPRVIGDGEQSSRWQLRGSSATRAGEGRSGASHRRWRLARW